MSTNNGNGQQYDKPATFVNVKRVRTGEQDAKGREKTTLTFGIGTDKNGNSINGLDALIDALLPYQGKQVNMTIYVEEKTSANGRTFPSAFVRVTEMIPKDQQQGQTKFVPKNSAKNASLKERSAAIQQQFSKG